MSLACSLQNTLISVVSALYYSERPAQEINFHWSIIMCWCLCVSLSTWQIPCVLSIIYFFQNICWKHKHITYVIIIAPWRHTITLLIHCIIYLISQREEQDDSEGDSMGRGRKTRQQVVQPSIFPAEDQTH